MTMLTNTEIAAKVTGRRSSRCPYPYLLVYTHEFTSGTLAGIRMVDSLPFCSQGDAEQWVAKINKQNDAGRNPYRATEHVVVSM